MRGLTRMRITWRRWKAYVNLEALPSAVRSPKIYGARGLLRSVRYACGVRVEGDTVQLRNFHGPSQ
jgi:hypothetical protein